MSDGCHYPTQWVYAGEISAPSSAAPDEASCGVGGGDTRGLPAKWSVKARESLRLVSGQREEVGGREGEKETAVSPLSNLGRSILKTSDKSSHKSILNGEDVSLA